MLDQFALLLLDFLKFLPEISVALLKLAIEFNRLLFHTLQSNVKVVVAVICGKEKEVWNHIQAFWIELWYNYIEISIYKLVIEHRPLNEYKMYVKEKLGMNFEEICKFMTFLILFLLLMIFS